METAIADLVRSVIKDWGGSANELANFSTVDKGIIVRFLRGERSITLETAQRILTALGCSVEIKAPPSNVWAEGRLIRVTRKRRRPGKWE